MMDLVPDLQAEINRLRDAWALVDADRYRAYRERDELRATLAPLLDDPIIRGPIGYICVWCNERAMPAADGYHDPRHKSDCPVLRKDDLLGH